MSWIDTAVQNAVSQAVGEIDQDATVGIGSGYTARKALELIAERIRRKNLTISFVPTSYQIEIVARSLKLTTVPLKADMELNVAIDGTDQLQRGTLDLIKGGGAALVREKIVANAAQRLIIILHEGKLCNVLGGLQPVPVEIIPFGYEKTLSWIQEVAGKAVLREGSGKLGPVITDNGNMIVDAYFDAIPSPKAISESLRSIPGVVETGLFLGLTDVAYVGRQDGTVEVLHS